MGFIDSKAEAKKSTKNRTRRTQQKNGGELGI